MSVDFTGEQEAKMTFEITVWKTIRENWSKVYPSTPDGYGAAFARAKFLIEKWGGDVDRFTSEWPDLGSQFSTALRCGDVQVSVRWLS